MKHSKGFYTIDSSNSAISASLTAVAGQVRENRFLFTGREWIRRIGIYDYRNRVYSPDLGRFLQTDPIRFDAGDGNIYRYVKNGVTKLKDPYGLCPDDEEEDPEPEPEPEEWDGWLSDIIGWIFDIPGQMLDMGLDNYVEPLIENAWEQNKAKYNPNNYDTQGTYIGPSYGPGSENNPKFP